MNKFERKAATLEALGYAYKEIENSLRYYYKEKRDKDGEIVTDENGEVIEIPPEEGDYNYSSYIGRIEALKILDGLKI